MGERVLKEKQYLFCRKAMPYFVKLDLSKDMIAFCNRDYETLIANPYSPEHNSNDTYKQDIWYYCDKDVFREITNFLRTSAHSFFEREPNIKIAYLYYDANPPWEGTKEKNAFLTTCNRIGAFLYKGEFTKQLGAFVSRGFPFYFDNHKFDISMSPSIL